MSRMEYEKFKSLIESYAEGHDITDIVAEVRSRYGSELAAITPFIVDDAILSFVRRMRQRRAKLEIAGHGDLFAEFSVRAMVTKAIVDPTGRKKNANVWQHHQTKADLKAHIERLENRPNRISKELVEARRLLEAIDKHCIDTETIEVALRRRKGL